MEEYLPFWVVTFAERLTNWVRIWLKRRQGRANSPSETAIIVADSKNVVIEDIGNKAAEVRGCEDVEIRRIQLELGLVE